MEEQKKYFIISTIMFVIIAIVILQVDKYHDNKVNNNYTLETNKLNNQYINVNDFGIYLQDKENSSKYNKKEDNTYPNEGYVLNTNLTKCYDYHGKEVKDQVSQTDEGRVRLETTISIYCQMYFDIDNELPTIDSFTISGTDKDNKTRNDYIYDYNINYTFSWKDDDVVYYCVKEGINACNESEWKKTNGAITKSGTITVNTEGAKTIYAYIRDKAKNVSSVMSKTITVDRTAPTISGFTLTGTTDNGTSLSDSSKYTHTTSVSANITWTDSDVASYCITTSSSCSTNEWTTISSQSATKSITTSTGQGNKSYNAFIKDKAGNVSTVKTGSIYLDTEKPTATISLNTSTETSITVTIGGTDSGSGIVKRECRASSPSVTSWVSTTGTSCTVSGLKDGTTHKIEVRTTDGSGRVSSVVSGDYATKKSIPGIGGYVFSKSPKGLNTTKELGGLYRFVGACDAKDGGCTNKVNNFICFGTDNPSNDCAGNIESEYMYRIIGIDPNTGDLKLIGNNYLIEYSATSSERQFAWHSVDGSIDWPNSTLYKRLNGLGSTGSWGMTGRSNLFIDSMYTNVQYITSNPDNKWYKMIKDTKWMYGDIGRYNSKSETNRPADEIYKIETGQLATKSGWELNIDYTWKNFVTAKIGLMYIHDYYYSYAAEGDDSSNTNCILEKSGCIDSWLHITNNGFSYLLNRELTITRIGGCGQPWYLVWWINYDGSVTAAQTDEGYAVRPVFYLDSTKAKISQGKGTYDEPFIVSEKVS